MQEKGFGKLVEEVDLQDHHLSVLEQEWCEDARVALAKDSYEPNESVLEALKGG